MPKNNRLSITDFSFIFIANLYLFRYMQSRDLASPSMQNNSFELIKLIMLLKYYRGKLRRLSYQKKWI